MKTNLEHGVLLKSEASYAAGATLAGASDGFLVVERPEAPVPQYVHDGKRQAGSGPMSTGIKRVAKSGRFGATTLAHEMHGAGAAYSASAKPSGHVALLAAGFDATLVTTGGSESYTYALGAGTSAAAEIYTREHKYPLTGVLADLTISADGPVVPVWEFAVQGIGSALPSEAAVPSITYPTTVPPKADPIVLAFGDYATAVVRSFNFALNRTISPRTNLNNTSSNAHAGFAGGARMPTLEILFETPAFVTTPFHASGGMNAYQLAELMTALSVSLTNGGTQYNRWKIVPPAAQIAELEEEDDGPVALWRAVLELNPTTPALKNNLTIVFD